MISLRERASRRAADPPPPFVSGRTLLNFLFLTTLLGVGVGALRLIPAEAARAVLVAPVNAAPVVVGGDDAPSPRDRSEAFAHRLAGDIDAVQQEIRAQRRRLLDLLRRFEAGETLAAADRAWLKRLARRYKIANARLERPADRVELRRRVDTLPPSLIIAQAAIESAWGASRFARRGNNYFGLWCFTPGCGIKPRQRAPGARHEVKRFPSVAAGLRGYLHLLNTGPPFRKLRRLRAEMRARGEPLNSLTLSAGLNRYAQIGERYSRLVRRMIRRNRFERWDAAEPDSR